MRDQGLFIPTYPTVIGFDMSGLVLEVGDNVPTGSTDNDSGSSFRPGTRVAAYAASFWKPSRPSLRLISGAVPGPLAACCASAGRGQILEPRGNLARRRRGTP